MLTTLLILGALAALVLLLAAWRWKRHEIDGAWSRLVDFAVRFRTHLIAGTAVLLEVLPEALHTFGNDPDVRALLSDDVRHWIGIVALLLVLWSRFRPAARASDPEIVAKRAAEEAANATRKPVPVMVDAGSGMVEVATVRPKGRGA